MSKKVIMENYKNKDVAVFGGYDRGKHVAEQIKYVCGGDDVELVFLSNLYFISKQFREGFDEVLPGKLPTDEEIEKEIFG